MAPVRTGQSCWPMDTVILEAVVGSTVHGTSVNDGLEDLNLMAVVVEDQKTFCGFESGDTWVRRTKPEGVRSEAGDTDWVGYGLRKFLKLALKGNPSVLIPLFAPLSSLRTYTASAIELRQMVVPWIISKACIAPIRGYITQQTKRMIGTRGQKNTTRPELVAAYGYDTNYAGHIVRRALQGAELLSTGRITLPMREHERQLVIDVRTGKFTFKQVQKLFEHTRSQFENAITSTNLPDKPNVDMVEQWMLETYLSHWAAR